MDLGFLEREREARVKGDPSLSFGTMSHNCGFVIPPRREKYESAGAVLELS